jgi:hypothetical protein
MGLRANEVMRRLYLDLLAFGLLIGTDFVTRLISIHTTPRVTVLSYYTDMLFAYGISVAVGFGRGFAERRFVGNTPSWIGGIEWSAIVIIEYALSCYVAVLLWPYDNFETVFGFGLLIVLVPSLALSLISYWFGLRLGSKLQARRGL